MVQYGEKNLDVNHVPNVNYDFYLFIFSEIN